MSPHFVSTSKANQFYSMDNWRILLHARTCVIALSGHSQQGRQRTQAPLWLGEFSPTYEWTPSLCIRAFET